MIGFLKKYIAAALAVCMLAVSGITVYADTTTTMAPSATASTPSITVNAQWDKSTYAAGETATLTLLISGTQTAKLSAFDFSLNYSKSVLSVTEQNKMVTSFTAGSIVPDSNYFSISCPTAGKLRVLYLDESSDQTAPVALDGELCSIQFTVSSKAKLGNYTMKLDNDGSFSDTQMRRCKVRMYDVDYCVQKSITDCTFSKITKKTFTGKRIKPTVKVTSGKTTLQSGVDYTVKYSKNKNVGTATATVVGMGNYAGSKKIKFKIVQKSLSACTVAAIPAQSYTAKKIKPEPSVLIGTVAMVKNTDYTVKYKNNKKIGIAAVTLTGINNLTGTVTKTFKIVPAKVVLKKAVSAKKGVVKITWKKSKGAQGYQLQYGYTTKWKQGTTVVVGKKRTYTVKGCSTGKKLYVRVRAYRKRGGKTYYGAYSKRTSVVVG